MLSIPISFIYFIKQVERILYYFDFDQRDFYTRSTKLTVYSEP